MKAINEKYQEGLDRFLKNESWRLIYDGAPDGAKESLELQFFISVMTENGKPISNEELLGLIRDRKTNLTKKDYEYLLPLAKDPRLRAAYEKCIKKFSE